MSQLAPYRSVLDPSFGNDWLISDPFRDQFFGNMKSSMGHDLAQPFSPLMTADLIETEGEFKVLADLPGIDPKDIELTLDKNSLIVRAERKHVHQVNTDKYHCLERSYGTVQRRIRLPKNADVDHAQTNFKDGVLMVTFPKMAEEPSKWRRLEINNST